MKDKRIYIAGHSGLIGSAIVNKLKKEGYKNIITRTHRELDLSRQLDTENFLKKKRPGIVILTAAKVGGIEANIKYPAQFLYDNLSIELNTINSSFRADVKKLLFFGSACCYPRGCPQPIKEQYLLSGAPELTNEAYAVAKIAGIKLCQAYNKQYGTKFICAIPTNIYGPHDNFISDDSHVIPALIRKFHAAKISKNDSVVVWGTGSPIREFIYVDDVADASIFLIKNYNKSGIINIGTQEEVSIKELVSIIKDIIGYNGKVVFDASKPDGSPRKSLEISKLKNLGWQAKIPLTEGIIKTYKWYLHNLGVITFSSQKFKERVL